MFAYYFRQTVPEGEIPTEEFETIVASTEDPEQFEQYLHDLADSHRESGRSQAHNFLKRFKEHATDIDHRQEVVNVLFSLSDYLIEADPSLNSLDHGNRSHLFQTVHTIADQAEDPSGLLKKGIRQEGSSYFAAYFIGLLLQEHGENGGNHPSLAKTRTA
ncbi:hypothetical protein PNP59_11410 [Halobacterium salinarum]|uniref:hypothetical protein n=1 Tax=Halobacterium salinarum TaxID=2242 RepID=UPI0025572D14|nr:hypothetical protein [Halobacterium salinarum]MDL0131533.1 hypothetical protein [Halobacterium salinarum]